MEKVTRTILGREIDERCPGYTFWDKILVALGVLGDKKENDLLNEIDEDLRKLEAREKS